MLVATTRKPSQDPGKLYSGDRGTAISLNSVDVSIPPDRNRKIGEVQWPSRMPPKPETEFAVTKVAKVQSDGQALDWYRRNRNSRRQVIIFVHGFNNTYADAVFRFAQIIHDSEPMPLQSSSLGRRAAARSTTSMTRRAPTTRVGLWRISSFRPQEVLMFKT
jgi:esterase/lipase superfamily enzyme